MRISSLPLDHSGLGVLPLEECRRRLQAAKVGRVSFVDQGEAVVFRTAPGSKLTAADNELPVAFEVDGFDEDHRTGWSVVIGGKATTVEEPAQLARLDLLGVSPWAGLAERTHWVRIRPYSMTGREIIYPTS